MHGAYRGLSNESRIQNIYKQRRIQPLSCPHTYGVEPRPAGNLSCLVPLRQYEHLEP